MVMEWLWLIKRNGKNYIRENVEILNLSFFFSEHRKMYKPMNFGSTSTRVCVFYYQNDPIGNQDFPRRDKIGCEAFSEQNRTQKTREC
jgi:hypothetical protein